jgi:hypothetical protein
MQRGVHNTPITQAKQAKIAKIAFSGLLRNNPIKIIHIRYKKIRFNIQPYELS